MDADLDARRRLVTSFLRRCRGWGSEREIPATLERLRADPTPKDAARLHQWTTWVAFLDHALGELERGELDRWLSDGDGEPVASPSTPSDAVAAPKTAG